jgi:hypothetical protein
MLIGDMHYGFKIEFNKIDSNQNRNIIIPQIDYFLNKALIVTTDKKISRSQRGLEISQKEIEDLKALFIKTNVSGAVSDPDEKVYPLPTDYYHYLNSEVATTKNTCASKARVYIKTHNDEFKNDPNYCSSFEWSYVNAIIRGTNINLYTDETFDLGTLKLHYVKKHPYMHNAEKYNPAGYITPSGVPLTGHQDCLLPDNICNEIVTLAVALASVAVQTADNRRLDLAINNNNSLNND